MRTRSPLALGLLAFVAGCGGSDAAFILNADGGVDGGPQASTVDASPDGGLDPPDAGPGGDTTRLACGATTCAIPRQSCCVSELKSGDAKAGYACVDGEVCPTANVGDTVALKCSSNANCAAPSICCIRRNNDRAASECKASCGEGEAQLCDPKASSMSCPSNRPCSTDNISNWGNLPDSFATCGGRSD